MDVRKTYKLFVNGEFVRSESGRAYRPDGNVNVPRGSRKDLRDAVRAARTAFPAWSGRTAMNRGQILYRAAEMLDGRGSQFIELLGGGARARRELDQAVETLVWYAGWTDKLSQVTGTVNPVSGPYFNFTIPEPTGVVGIVAPEDDALGGLVRRIAPALCGGNVVVALAAESHPLAALTLAEVLATSDLPGGVVNILSGQRKELIPWLAAHMDVNAIDVAGCTGDEIKSIEEAAAGNVKRVIKVAATERSPYLVSAFMEMKTVWHPIGV
ncbi:MAG: aldehyde dehydrogenase family protein [Chloroflexi bacterium]|nr:MAG: aldehyde dehydrogenase family protein [Chloroflexota bacterium]TME55058.1 MAG: aldehyde dehydrogenase family protein [Chloroflexota bacterium]